MFIYSGLFRISVPYYRKHIQVREREASENEMTHKGEKRDEKKITHGAVGRCVGY